MTGKEWAEQFLKPGAIEAFEQLTDNERLWILTEKLGRACSRCGGFGPWCCYDPE